MSNESNDLEKNISHLDPTGVDNAYIPPEQPETKHSRFNIDRDTLRNHFIAAVGEFCGTFMFLWCAYVICNVANHDVALTTEPEGSHPGQLIMIALCFGFSVMFSIWCFAGVSGGALNPAVSLSLCLARAISPARFLMTAVEKRETNFMAALPIGISLFMPHMALTGYTGTGVNPARSLGAAVAARYFPHYHWIYWIGPLLGAFLAWSVWQLLQILDYTTYVNAEKAAGQKKED
ncbi:BEM_HP_G0087230.mRNA.1.CDS.1 [Saccharomyces cerevisiae]|nr:BEM_HP_G0085130.mRNA.1.CDS.1 [Saccharomyces cerevisiae]CAI5174218.1 BEM_HP_G0087230.mRNA.1.CDS.1 [Saccharomyces cerevisiae]CAI6996651.1 BEM_HP_G0085130.mRNA.1.CDS.1 [Saccharomyces cerevisiae]CAI6998516.1 BEM_HP_G0087230.mRNA.1.CDS.1 [Saccharomyces cerevisiae]